MPLRNNHHRASKLNQDGQTNSQPKHGIENRKPLYMAGGKQRKEIFQRLAGITAIPAVSVHQLRERQPQGFGQRFQGIDIGKTKSRFP